MLSNVIITLVLLEKQTYFGNINAADVTDIKTFWRTVKPLFYK